MGFFDALTHLLNLCAPAIGLGAVAAALAKLVYRKDLATAPWHTLAPWAMLAALVMQLGGLVVFGRDGKLATYAAMVAASALTLWWRGFLARR